MKKTPSVFQRNPNNMSELLDEPHPDALWVLAGEGKATRKYDGTCMLLDDHYRWWARREVKKGKPDPDGFWFIGEDPTTGKRMGWLPAKTEGYYHPLIEALGASEECKEAGRSYGENSTRYNEIITGHSIGFVPGTYELCGPKINGNPEKYLSHILIEHRTADRFNDTYCGSYDWGQSLDSYRTGMDLVGTLGWEGLVWHHPDGRMAKLKVRDFKNR